MVETIHYGVRFRLFIEFSLKFLPQHNHTHPSFLHIQERYFPNAFKRLGEGLTSSSKPWTIATFQQLEMICGRIQERLGRLAPGIVAESKFKSEALKLKAIIESNQHLQYVPPEWGRNL